MTLAADARSHGLLFKVALLAFDCVRT